MHSQDYEKRIRESIQASRAVTERFLASADSVTRVAEVASLLVTALKEGNKVLLFGNGGSAADAQHIATELVGRFSFHRPALPALSLTVDTSCITAVSNDYGFETIFARQIEALGRPGDVAIGISTSGNSANVVCGLTSAKSLGLHTVALSGCTGGKIKAIADYCICAPADEIPRIQECHILLGHILAELVEQTLFHDSSRIPRS